MQLNKLEKKPESKPKEIKNRKLITVRAKISETENTDNNNKLDKFKRCFACFLIKIKYKDLKPGKHSIKRDNSTTISLIKLDTRVLTKIESNRINNCVCVCVSNSSDVSQECIKNRTTYLPIQNKEK